MSRWFELQEDESDEDHVADERNPSREEAGKHLIELLLYLRLAGNISAKLMCIVCWWAHRAGAVGGVEAFARPPWLRSTGHYQRHIDTKMGFRDQWGDRFAYLNVPGYALHSGRRTTHRLAVIPPHESLRDELLE